MFNKAEIKLQSKIEELQRALDVSNAAREEAVKIIENRNNNTVRFDVRRDVTIWKK